MRRRRLTAGLTLLGAFAAASVPAHAEPPEATRADPIIVRPPPTEAERERELRDFARAVIRPAKLREPIAKFAFPVCVEVRGLAPDDAAVIAERIRDNARALGVGADDAPDCVPTVRVAFMAPAAGPAAQWLTQDSPQLAHLAGYQRERVLGEPGPVRAWNKVAVRDATGKAFRPQLGDQFRFPTFTEIEPLSASDPIATTEITGAAVLIGREAAEGLTLGQLADYATMRALLGTGAPEGAAPALTILTLFSDPRPPEGLTDFDRALVRELYDASRNAKPRRVFTDIARAAVAAERSDVRDEAP
ncbi:hypothetical protein [Erythrobacter donghaensis]|uniref:hypothetical protein n=1 Tax=Erythrobacter donghaensis TaxID=267135 RepID=UPI000A39B518|nr:hypothetical protein [Erythrobacter donghaensis]